MAGMQAGQGFLATPVSMSRDEARHLAENKGGLLGKVLIRKRLSGLELKYYPFYIVKLKTDYAVRASRLPDSFRLAVDGTSGRCALADAEINLVDLPADASLVESDFTEEEVIRYASKHANRYLIKTRRTAAMFKDEVVEPFYRPFWVAFYGEPEEGRKVWYLPFEADGFCFGYA